ncbi:RNA polymerase sigma factor [Mucilaginibacter sp. UR6-11]|uniref:RNA polymerase sigma factor n=1 Tax=Mucilaginibacter sp. UR6-11 TaxID=1435644 RepID=UPI001E4EF20E|nr:RNA polymerase sigma factor [Mucilaginibacter sp. UR6-11]MCC8424262.1 RNA polymerase sigma factor [Mucilaginibacter sp. UR6-11]
MNIKSMINTDSLSDEDIVERIINGQSYLYETIMRRLNARMFRISMSFIGDDMEAEDIMQNTYIYAYRSLGSFNKRAKFNTWITRILINECILRKKKLQHRQKVINAKRTNDIVTHTPLNDVMNKELKQLLENAIAALPDKYRMVFVMREMEDMSTQETMEVLGIEESNVKIRLMRAKMLLRDQLKDYYRSPEIFEFHLSRCDRVVDVVMQQITQYKI